MNDGIELIKRFEGFSAKAYKCPAGVWTIGYGSTTWEDGRPVRPGDTITQVKAEALVVDWLNKNVRPKLANVRLNPSQVAAIESLVYNIGWANFSRSKCWAAIQKRNWGDVYLQWNWIIGGGKVLNGLIKRRAAEKALFFAEI